MSEIVTYKFNNANVDAIKKMKYGYDWPIVYIINNKKEVYIGQTTGADGKFFLQNLAVGFKTHSYYQRQLYQDKFNGIWSLLRKNNLVNNDLLTIQNSDLFKFSPYKTLSEDQYDTSYKIFDSMLEHMEKSEKASFMVNGGAGTGKTVLAVYLFKMIIDFYDNKYNMEGLGEEYTFLKHKLLLLRENEEFEIGLVIPMTSLRQTLKTVFSKIKGLKASMVIGPSDVLKKRYTLLIVDEAHRLRRRTNLTNYGTFDKNNEELFLGKEGTELDWIKLCSDYQIFFYDKTQSVKPTDVRENDFKELMNNGFVDFYTLTSQLRVGGGNDYINYINNLFDQKNQIYKIFDNYDFKIFDKVDEMIDAIKAQNKIFELCRNVAGYAWEWKTKNAKQGQNIQQDKWDIEIDNHQYIWNTTGSDWVNSKNAINEIGCIHTIQGYDLKYAGIILGHEIKFDPKSQKIVIDKEQYYDKNGRNGIKDDKELSKYIINIYKVLMTRGIKGTYIYVCDENLRAYFKQYIVSASK